MHTLLAHSALLPTNIPKSLSTGLLSSHSSSHLHFCLALLCPGCRTWHLDLLNFMPLTMPVQKGSILLYFGWSVDLMSLQVWGFGTVGDVCNYFKFFSKQHIVSGSCTSPNISTDASGKKLATSIQAAHNTHQFYTSHCKQLEIVYFKPATLQRWQERGAESNQTSFGNWTSALATLET